MHVCVHVGVGGACACMCVLNCHSVTVSKKVLVDVRKVTLLVIHSVQDFAICVWKMRS